MKSQPEWTFNDGWILMSVFLMHGADGASLSYLIAAADAMNHAIPTSGELTRSLTRLAKCRVLANIDGRYRISTDYLSALTAANDKRGGLFATPEIGKKWLTKNEFEIDEDAEIPVTQDDVTAAFDEYRSAIRGK